MHKARGFTLLEITIVLVIIALIIGGVFAGKELIVSAKVNAQVAQFEEFRTVLNAFKNKYSCIPGDCAKATTLGLGANGNGNGAIDDTSTLEQQDFWVHLQSARFVTLTTVPHYAFAMPRAKINNGMIWTDVSNSWALISPAASWCSGGDSCPAVNPLEAWMMDSKADDGLPYSGTIKVTGGFTDYAEGNAGPSEGARGTDVCVNTDVTPNVYNTTVSNPLCVVLSAFQL